MLEMFYTDDVVVMQLTTYILFFLSMLIVGFFLMNKDRYNIKGLIAGNFSYLAMHLFVLWAIHSEFRFIVFVGMLDLLGVSLYMTNIYRILKRDLNRKIFLGFNFINVIILLITSNVFTQVSISRMVTSTFIVILVIYSLRQVSSSKATSSMRFVLLNVYAILLVKFGLVFVRSYTSVIEISIESIVFTINLFTLLNLFLILWMNLSVLFLNYDKISSDLEFISYNDYLTRIPNRRYADAKVEEYYKLFLRDKLEFAIVLLDLDEFKQINDKYGHDYGDKVLQGFTEIVSREIRDIDFFARHGGDEFLLLLHVSNQKELDVVMNRVISEVSNANFTDRDIALSFSAGTFLLTEKRDITINQLFSEVDKLLYKAKDHEGIKVISK